ncbi:IS6 family transposase [Litoreibacter roseus]|uniref:IS6 family transposase n=1 Tax=Litoreibacter roseus TaxID=2601869 RepID=A0A6N6JMP2_9RHOB|nr:IS6 family transposase [Litoreibacter roseus]GFE67287.1 IS6 family transposase [Litoreibacter roseus]
MVLPLSYRDVRNLLEKRGITVDAATVYRWVQKFGPEIRKRAHGWHRGWRGVRWHVDETYVRVNGRWCYLWRAVDQCGQLIDDRLTARRTANAARAFMRQASDTVRCDHPLTIVTDNARSCVKVIGEWNARSGPDDAIRHVTRKHLNNRIEGDHAVLKHRLTPMRGFHSLGSAKAVLKGVETFRATRRGHFAGCERGVANEIAFVWNLFVDGKKTA